MFQDWHVIGGRYRSGNGTICRTSFCNPFRGLSAICPHGIVYVTAAHQDSKGTLRRSTTHERTHAGLLSQSQCLLHSLINLFSLWQYSESLQGWYESPQASEMDVLHAF
jgi:hypothetical protein